MHSTRQIPAVSAAAAAGTLTAAFHADPVFRWWIPDEARRREILPAFFELVVGGYLQVGEVHATDDVASCALWAPPGAEDDPAMAEAIAGVAGEYAEPVFDILERMAAQHPADEHWYLNFLGTRPDRQSRGLGSAVMRPMLDRCDTAGIPAYLEATSDGGVALYRRHGFEVVGEIALPGGPSLWPMWREAR